MASKGAGIPPMTHRPGRIASSREATSILNYILCYRFSEVIETLAACTHASAIPKPDSRLQCCVGTACRCRRLSWNIRVDRGLTSF
jgi:hypothetical protein